MQIPAALKGLKPGEIGLVVLGRVVMGDIAVTLVDLAQRNLLRIEETDDRADWLLTSRGVSARGATAEYETKLLKKLAGRGKAVSLRSLAADFGGDLGEVRRSLEREAVAQGWVRRLHHDQRTPEGEELARRVRSFHRELRQFKFDGDADAIGGGTLLPFALRFGLVPGDQLPLARFAHDWVRTFGDLPGWRPAQPARDIWDNYGPMFPEVHGPSMPWT